MMICLLTLIIIKTLTLNKQQNSMKNQPPFLIIPENISAISHGSQAQHPVTPHQFQELNNYLANNLNRGVNVFQLKPESRQISHIKQHEADSIHQNNFEEQEELKKELLESKNSNQIQEIKFKMSLQKLKNLNKVASSFEKEKQSSQPLIIESSAKDFLFQKKLPQNHLKFSEEDEFEIKRSVIQEIHEDSNRFELINHIEEINNFEQINKHNEEVQNQHVHFEMSKINEDLDLSKQKISTLKDQKLSYSKQNSIVSDKSAQLHKHSTQQQDINHQIFNLQKQKIQEHIYAPSEHSIDSKMYDQTKKYEENDTNNKMQHFNYQNNNSNEIFKKSKTHEQVYLSNLKTEVIIKNVEKQIDEDTDFSELNRDVKILEHHQLSNLNYLKTQIKELLIISKNMILDEEKRQTKRKLIILDIENRREKISLRTASYSKKYNFISPITKNNHKIQYKSPFKIKEEVVWHYEELKQQISKEKQLHINNENKIILLNNYCDMIKIKKIPDEWSEASQYNFDSKLEKYSKVQSKISKKNNLLNKKQSLMVGLKEIQEVSKNYQTSHIKFNLYVNEAQNIVELFQILKRKRQTVKDMILENQVFTLGKVKRLKYQNALLKKEIQFINKKADDLLIDHREQFEQIENKSKPKKVSYENFKVNEVNAGLYTKSPYKEYNGTNNGDKTLNVYRGTMKSSAVRALNKSISDKKYIIKRQHQWASPLKYHHQNTSVKSFQYEAKLGQTQNIDLKRLHTFGEGRFVQALKAPHKIEENNSKQKNSIDHNLVENRTNIIRTEASLKSHSKSIDRSKPMLSFTSLKKAKSQKRLLKDTPQTKKNSTKSPDIQSQYYAVSIDQKYDH